MRDYKFRGKRIDNSEWHFGDLFHAHEQTYIGKDCEDHRVKSTTVGQFTGLYDKNGREIYEGDILRIYGLSKTEKMLEQPEIDVVNFDRGAFVFAPSLKHRGLTLDKMFERHKAATMYLEVIGNIYETPELLEGVRS